MGQLLPRGLLVQRRQRIQLLPEGGLVGDGGHIRMVEGVVAHDVALVRHALHKVGGGFDHVAHHEKGGVSVVLLQRVQDLGRVAVFIAAVKGEVNDFFRGVPHIIGVVPGKIRRAGVSHGRLPLGGEGKPPVGGGGRHVGGGGHGRVAAAAAQRQQHNGKAQQQRRAFSAKTGGQTNSLFLSGQNAGV